MAPADAGDNVTGCREGMACVNHTGGGTVAPGGVGYHMANMALIFEDPPYGCASASSVCDPEHQVTYVWTDDPNKSHKEVNEGDPSYIYLHAKHLALHELGHTLGLPDFYVILPDHPAANYDRRLDGETAIMNKPWKAKSIQNTDIEQLDAIYRIHTEH